MNHGQYIQIAIEELLNPSFEDTKQYLEGCELELIQLITLNDIDIVGEFISNDFSLDE